MTILEYPSCLYFPLHRFSVLSILFVALKRVVMLMPFKSFAEHHCLKALPAMEHQKSSVRLKNSMKCFNQDTVLSLLQFLQLQGHAKILRTSAFSHSFGVCIIFAFSILVIPAVNSGPEGTFEECRTLPCKTKPMGLLRPMFNHDSFPPPVIFCRVIQALYRETWQTVYFGAGFLSVSKYNSVPEICFCGCTPPAV